MNTLQTSYTNKKIAYRFLALTLIFVVSVLLSLSLGSTKLSLKDAFLDFLNGNFTTANYRILFAVRLPRISACVLAGIAFSISGILLQAVLQNPLASPNIIGVNSGAGFFVFLLMAFFPEQISWLPVGAFLGSLFAMLIIYLIAYATGASKTTIILSGIAVSSIFTAGINAIKTFFPDTLYNGSSFLIGSFSGVMFKNLNPAYVLIILGVFLAYFLGNHIDVLCLGRETASSLGMNVGLTRFVLIFIACILAGSAVSFSGLVSFIGLIVPHIARKIFGNEHRVLIPSCCILGASFTLLCDLLSRLIFAPYEIAVGILMSLIGGPFFILLIVTRKHRRIGG